MCKIIEFYKKYRNDIFKPVIVLLCICIVIPLALAVTNRVTEERIEKLSIQKRNTAMSRLVKADEFKEDTFKFQGEDITYYTALKSGEITAFVFINKENGYGGAVEKAYLLVRCRH
ncbi:MAG: hypothetical protein II802_00330 [Clostridia bacterium]|nr:hypothetical protein [Clostridia bacterium]